MFVPGDARGRKKQTCSSRSEQRPRRKGHPVGKQLEAEPAASNEVKIA